METITKAAELTSKSRAAIRGAIKSGRIAAKKEKGVWMVDPAAVARACGPKVGRSGIPGVSWCEGRQKWRAVYKKKTVYESADINECAAALDAYKRGQLETAPRALPTNVYPEGNYFRVMIRRGGEIVFSERAGTIAEAVAARDGFLQKQKSNNAISILVKRGRKPIKKGGNIKMKIYSESFEAMLESNNSLRVRVVYSADEFLGAAAGIFEEFTEEADLVFGSVSVMMAHLNAKMKALRRRHHLNKSQVDFIVTM